MSGAGEEVLKVAELAEALGVDPSRVYGLIHRSGFPPPAEGDGTRMSPWRWRLDDVQVWVHQHVKKTVTSAPEAGLRAEMDRLHRRRAALEDELSDIDERTAKLKVALAVLNGEEPDMTGDAAPPTEGSDQAVARIGANIKGLREARSLSLSELARRSGVAKGWLHRMENDAGARPSVQNVHAVAATLGVTVDALLSDSPGAPARPRPGLSRTGTGRPGRRDPDECRDAIRDAAAACPGETLTVDRYKRWREDVDQAAPSWDTVVEKLGGSWVEAVRSVSPDAAPTPRNRWTDEQMLGALTESGAKTMDDYDAWRSTQDDGRPLPVAGVIGQRFDGWLNALAAIGRDWDPAQESRAAAARKGSQATEWPHERLTDALERSDAQTAADYDAWRAVQDRAEPSSRAITDRFGGWLKALAAIGREPTESQLAASAIKRTVRGPN